MLILVIFDHFWGRDIENQSLTIVKSIFRGVIKTKIEFLRHHDSAVCRE